MALNRGEGTSNFHAISISDHAQAHIGHTYSYTTNYHLTEKHAKAIFKACNLSREAFGPFLDEIGQFRVLLLDTKEAVEEQDLGDKVAQDFGAVLEGCHKDLAVLERFIEHYNGLSPSTQLAWERMPLVPEQLEDMKVRLRRCLDSLKSINSTITTGHLTQHILDKFIKEILSGKRDGHSVLSAVSSRAEFWQDASGWKIICRELEGVGITAQMFADYQQDICKRLRELAESGDLQEQLSILDSVPSQDFKPNADHFLTQTKSPAEDREQRKTQLSWSSGPRNQRASRRSDRNSLVLQAVRNGQANRLKMLLETGANAEATDESGYTALILAICYGFDNIISILLKNGVNTEATNNSGQTALILACMSGFDKVATLLIKNGANIDARDCVGGTCLTRAIDYGHNKVLKVLLKHGADVDARGDGGRTALHAAIRGNHLETFQILLEHGADVNERDGDGRTALIYAIFCANNKALRTLLEYGPDVNIRYYDGRTALQDTIYGNKYEALKILLDYGAEVDARNDEGNTTLIEASWGLNVKGVELLIAAGADRKAVDLATLSVFRNKEDLTKENLEKRRKIVKMLQE